MSVVSREFATRAWGALYVATSLFFLWVFIHQLGWVFGVGAWALFGLPVALFGGAMRLWLGE